MLKNLCSRLLPLSLLTPLFADYQIFMSADKEVHCYHFSTSDHSLELVAFSPLEFNGRTVTLHPNKEVLYVNGSHKKQESLNATCQLDASGKVTSFSKTEGAIGSCALQVDFSKNFLLSASYKSGEVQVHRILEDGKLGEQTALLNANRKTAHDICLSVDNKHLYLPFVKENNALFQYRFDEENGTLTPHETLSANSPEGTGPRNGFLHPDGKIRLL